jgi:hypothetical protein
MYYRHALPGIDDYQYEELADDVSDLRIIHTGIKGYPIWADKANISNMNILQRLYKVIPLEANLWHSSYK